MIIITPTITVNITKEAGFYVARTDSVVGKGKTPADALRNFRIAAKNAEDMFPGFFTNEMRI